jgi:hypothetical protein
VSYRCTESATGQPNLKRYEGILHCQNLACRAKLETQVRRRGEPKKFCSDRCRLVAYRADKKRLARSKQTENIFSQMIVTTISAKEAGILAVEKHYLRRRPSISFSFGLWYGGKVVGFITLGIPASREMLIGACPAQPELVLELNRMWLDDSCPRNSETYFLARVLALLPPRLILSYADLSSQAHAGIVYRAAGWRYAGWTDMQRKTPRWDFVCEGNTHSRDAFRNGERRFVERRRRTVKVKYWTTSGTKRDRKRLESLCVWPALSWKEFPPPLDGHRQLII